jgi:hypothetical protein
MTFGSILLVATIVGAVATTPAHATECRDWNRLSESGKWNRIDRMIGDAIAGPSGRTYEVNRNAIGRCLDNNAQSMFWDFDDLCGDPDTARMNAIRARFKQYIWTCVN